MIRARILDAAGFGHGFGARGEPEAGVPAAVGASPERFFRARQVHGRAVHVVGAADRPDRVALLESDALVAHPADAVAVVTADCVPVLLADQRSGRVAAVHAGWRGVEAGVLDAAVEALVRAGTDPRGLLAAIGPHIRACCFEVGDDVARRLQAAGARLDRTRGKPRVDLASALAAGLAARGVPHVEDVGGCTMCEPDRFHSHRREGPGAGRQISAIRAR